MRIFDKKFKMKVSYFAEDYYTVSYANYYLIPIYRSLCYWFEGSLLCDVESWSGKLFKIKEAEEIAQSLKCIEDVVEYHRPEREKQSLFYERKAEYYKKAIPYGSKKF